MQIATYGLTRDQMMARLKANHIQLTYANSVASADLATYTKAALATQLGIDVSFCGTKAKAARF